MSWKKGENRVKNFFRSLGYPVYTYGQYQTRLKNKTLPSQYVVREFRYDGWYNDHYSRADFVVFNGKRRTSVEVKYQSVSGTADEKLIQVAMNAFKSDHVNRSIILVLGDGFRSRAIECLNEVVDDFSEFYPGKNVRVVDDFATFKSIFLPKNTRIAA